jgi:hypothetical protein
MLKIKEIQGKMVMRMTGLKPAQAEAHYPLKVLSGFLYPPDLHIVTNLTTINCVRLA